MMLIKGWKKKAPRYWSVQLALFWGALTGAVLALSAFSDIIEPRVFLLLNVFGYAAIAVARVTDQPGVD